LPAVAARLKIKALLLVFMLIGMSLEDYTCSLLFFYSFGYWGDCLTFSQDNISKFSHPKNQLYHKIISTNQS
jgi:hypothetical protein